MSGTPTTPEEVVRAWFDAFAANDMDAARRLLHDEAVLHASHPRELAGDHEGGLDTFLEWYQRKRSLEGDDFTYEVHALLSDDSHAAALLNLRSRRDGRDVEWRQIAVYHVDRGRITEIWLHEDPSDAPPS